MTKSQRDKVTKLIKRDTERTLKRQERQLQEHQTTEQGSRDLAHDMNSGPRGSLDYLFVFNQEYTTQHRPCDLDMVETLLSAR
jgi:hypothetical protein